MSCPHGEWHEEDCEACQKEDELYARIAALEANLAALEARGCDGCEYWVEGVQRTCNANVAVFLDEMSQDYDEPPSEFYCNRWSGMECDTLCDTQPRA